MYGRFEYITDLQYRGKALEARIRAFESGEKYMRMRDEHREQLAGKDREIAALKREVAESHAREGRALAFWMQSVDDIEKENARALRRKDRRIDGLEKRVLTVERQRDAALDKIKELRSEMYRIGGELEEEQGKNKRLTAQLKHDHENSSLSFSMKPNHKPIANNREKTSRKPGGQPGHEGHEGVKGTPAEDYEGIIVHDHDKTFYNYGTGHQDCVDHALRYLKDSIQNEPGLSWNSQMRELLREMIHYRNSLGQDEDLDPDVVALPQARYNALLDIAKSEYEYEPPGKYYMDGYNLYRRLDEYRENYLLFLHDKRVPPDNNLSERLLRVFKRKLRQMMTFRSFDSLDSLCLCMGVIASLSSRDQNIYKRVSELLD